MDRHEIEEEAAETHMRAREPRESTFPSSFFSSANVLTFLGSALMVAFSWGVQTRQMDDMQDDISALMARDMTPGAQAAIGEIKVFDHAIEQRVVNIESEMRSQRMELMAILSKIDSKLDQHMDGDRARDNHP
jgi:hypothetical protein